MSGEIDSKTELIDKLYLQLGHWRTKITQNKKECEDRLVSLTLSLTQFFPQKIIYIYSWHN